MTTTDSQSNKFGYGFLYGLGMDVAITPNVFLRGEWEYIAFNKVGGIRSTLNTGRVGLGVVLDLPSTFCQSEIAHGH